MSELIEGGDRFKCVSLMEDGYAVLLSKDHPAAAEPELSLERFAELPHIVITSGNDTDFVDEQLAEWGLVRRVFAKVMLLSLVVMLVGSEAVAVVPTRAAAGLVAVCPLVMQDLPLPSPRITLCMIWHRLDNHPAHRWLRATIRASIDGEEPRAGSTRRAAACPAPGTDRGP